ncbi:methoxymalonyl-ACP biosynthesis protein [Pseudomonas rhizosphaerae]|uniref:Methoxymalonyl-ACP biosynthesis protein n=1 Tax=Pseudomonas rhizosphaerae TaxID=216142 RepID=A0A089YVY8_9PSED|nr:HAD-IIIC family phosphatase [Pseudomonas rhizosphaerae]AIS17870.1 methoxymalonyl-ACP biosynthesis protein [Pseudomonas rhizosphaerae]
MEQLAWLAQHPNLGAAISTAKSLSDPVARLHETARLAAYRRDFTLTLRLDRLAQLGIDLLARQGQQAVPGFTSLRMAVLASHTVDHLLPGIRVAALQRQVGMSLYLAPYGLYRQALLGDDPALKAFAPQVILLALDALDSPPSCALYASAGEAEHAVQARVEELRLLWRQARERYGAQVIQQTLVPAGPALFGHFDALVPGSPRALLERLNAEIRRAAREDGVLLMDLAWSAASGQYGDGLADPVRWHQAKQLVSPIWAPLYGEHVARIAAAVVGRSRKCLVLDLDNTLWGGVVGDDGVDGLYLGQGSATGEAFLAFQRYAAQLARRGVILAVCSKNDIQVAEAAFEHPEMALERSDIAVFMANWEDKASNLRRIAEQLNIGLDSLVFVDDNPAERDIVRRELPQVAVPELPDDVADYPARVAAGGYFEAIAFTADDSARVQTYRANSERQAALGQATDMAGYLKGLQMVMQARPIGAAELARATQLINKTNQFNLSTRRYSEVQVQQLANTPGAVALSLRLTDKFGDNGLISVVLARPDAACASDELFIDTWLMSCRVLGRQAEQAALQVLARHAADAGYSALIGEYRPSERNAMVAEHYPQLGFAQAPNPDPASTATLWRYPLAAPSDFNHHIEIRHD